jgi:hypothetical protein
MKPTINPLPKAKKYFFFSDVHGNWQALQKITQTPEWQDPDTLFVFLGDLFDGRDSQNPLDFLACWNFLYDNQDKILWALGNHDQFLKDLLQATDSPESKQELKNWLHSGGKSTLEQLGINRRQLAHLSPLSFKNQIWDNYPNLCKYLVSRPYGYYNEHIIGVHAGLNPIAWTASSLTDVIWAREGFYGKANLTGHTVVIGHTPVQNLADSPAIIAKGNVNHPIYMIDGGSSSEDPSGQINGLLLTEDGKKTKELKFK